MRHRSTRQGRLDKGRSAARRRRERTRKARQLFQALVSSGALALLLRP